MRQHLLHLYELQKIDLSIRDDEQRAEHLPAGFRTAQAALTALTARSEQLAQEKATAEREARELNALLDDEREKIRKWESRLGDLRNQREYQALHRETEGQRRANRDHEEKLQVCYKLQETLDEQMASVAEQVGVAQAACKEQEKAVSSDMAELSHKITEDRARRSKLVPNIPTSLFRKYDTIRAKRQGMGLSVVRNGSCVSCNMRLPPQLYNVLQRADTIEQCPSCFRLICWEEWLDPSEQQPKAPEPPAKVAKPAKKARAPRKASSASKASPPASAAEPEDAETASHA